MTDATTTIPHITRTLHHAAALLDAQPTPIAPALSEALSGLLSQLAETDHQPVPAYDAPEAGTCAACGGTGERYYGTGPDGHIWSGESCCCDHTHCGCGSCAGFPCELAQWALEVASALGVDAVQVHRPASHIPAPPPGPGEPPF